MNVVEIVITGPADDTQTIVDRLLEGQLIACAHVAPIKSQYWWQGRIEKAEENRIWAHSVESNWPQINKIVNDVHSYDVVCCTLSRLSGCDSAYGRWVQESVRT